MVCEKGFWFIKDKLFGSAAIRQGEKNVPKHQDAIQFRTAGDGAGNSRLRPAIRAKAVRLQQAVAGQRRSFRSRDRGGKRRGAAAPDLAAHACTGARPRHRGRKGAGALEDEVWKGLNGCWRVRGGAKCRELCKCSSLRAAAKQSTRKILDCFVAHAPRNDGYEVSAA